MKRKPLLSPRSCWWLALGFSLAAGFSGCADKNTALFVTNTSLGIDFDSEPPMGSIGYDRTEGYIGPRYDNGVVPPVVAALESDNSFLRGNIRQVYATGRAASLVARQADDQALVPVDQPLPGTGKLMFFGTTTTIGLKVGFSTAGLPSSFVFGYKRKEASVLPLGTVKDGDETLHYYPSVIASIDTTGAANPAPNESGLKIMQFFGTGEAAEFLALNKKVQAAFKDRAESALGQYREEVASQNQAAADLLTCYQAIPFENLPEVWQDALRHELLDSQEDLDALSGLHVKATEAQASGDLAEREKNLIIADSTYAGLVAVDRGAQPTRTPMLAAHRNFVCDLAREKFPS